MLHRTILALWISVAAALLHPTCIAASSSTEPPVGLTLAKYEDAARMNWDSTGPRPLITVVWYPAPSGTSESAWSVAIFKADKNAIGAPLASSPTKLPLILISHGTGGSAATMAWLGEALARHGYMVAAVNHHGNTGYESANRLEGFVVWWDRPQDLLVVLNKLLADPRFGPRIDTDRIGVAGFSVGGYTALATVGARLGYDQWLAFCATHTVDSNCRLPPEAKYSDTALQDMLTHNQRVKEAITHVGDSFKDARIKAAFVIAPALGPVMTTASLASIHVPVYLVAGINDTLVIPAFNVKAIAASVPDAKLDMLAGVSHYTFLPECNWVGAVIARQYCLDAKGVDRNAVHDRVSTMALQFFDSILLKTSGGTNP